MTLRRISPRRQKLNAAVKPWRDQFKTDIGRCEYCLRPCSAERLTLHEIARGPNRTKCLTAPFGLLCVHWTYWTGSALAACHADVQDEPLARQLARLYLVRSHSYDLDAFHKLTARCFPDQSSVDEQVSILLNGDKP